MSLNLMMKSTPSNRVRKGKKISSFTTDFKLQKVEEFRKSSKISSTKFAEKIGVPKSTFQVSSVEMQPRNEN